MSVPLDARAALAQHGSCRDTPVKQQDGGQGLSILHSQELPEGSPTARTGHLPGDGDGNGLPCVLVGGPGSAGSVAGQVRAVWRWRPALLQHQGLMVLDSS